MASFPFLSLVSGIPSSYVALAGCVLGIVTYRFAITRRGNPPFPPGPKGLPIVGNIRDIPLEKEWLTYAEWAKQYGPIVSVEVLGLRVVIVNSGELCRELFESRSGLYSNRPNAPMLNMMGYGEWLVGLLQPGPQWTKCRKVLGQVLNPQSVQQWREYESQAVGRLVVSLLDDPSNFYSHVERNVAGFFLKTLYGHQIPATGEDEFFAMHTKSLQESSKAISSGVYLVNVFPSIRYIPEWMIGGGFHKDARAAFTTCQQILHGPMEKIKREMAQGKAAASYVSKLLAESQDEFSIKQTAATSYNAGTTGTKAILLSSFLMMTLHPDAQRKAQQEIHAHCGKDRLPTHDDRPSLPYTEAFVKELFRLTPPAPVGLPRCLAKDDVIGGYFIPAGSLMIFNTWSVLHDETQYSKPYEFIPERHLDAKGFCMDPSIEGFGYGKRICPGRHVVDEFTWLVVASVLAMFDIEKAIDADGNPITPRMDYTPGLFSAPMPFKTRIKPHSPAAEQLIRKAASWDTGR